MMKHDELKNLAAAYSLDALEKAEKAMFEAHLNEGCEDCHKLVKEFGMAVDFLGSDWDEVRPRPKLKDKILGLVDAEDTPNIKAAESPFFFVMTNEGDWISIEEGVTAKILFEDRQRKTTTMIVQMEAGSEVSGHPHDGAEELFILEGDCFCAGRHLKAGDYHRAASGSTHATTTTQNGCKMIVISPLAA